MRNLLGFDPDDDRTLDGLTQELPRVFEMPEDRSSTMSFRPVSTTAEETPAQAARARRTSTRASTRTTPAKPRHARAYAVVTALAVAAILVSGAWAIDSARWHGAASSEAAVAAANAQAKLTKAKKHAKKTKKKAHKKAGSSASKGAA